MILMLEKLPETEILKQEERNVYTTRLMFAMRFASPKLSPNTSDNVQKVG